MEQIPINRDTVEAAIRTGAYGTLRFHQNGCERHVGPRGGIKDTIVEYRANGQLKTWKRDPNRFSLPLKHGFRGPHDYLTEDNANEFHWPDECPIWQDDIKASE